MGYNIGDEMIAFINGDNKNSIDIPLPKGVWNVLISTNDSMNNKFKEFEGQITLNPTSGILLFQK